MKRILRGLSLCMMLAACGSGNGDDKSIGFETLTKEKTVSITNESGAPACSVRLELACAKESAGERAKAINNAVASQLLNMEGLSLKQAADSFANSYTRGYVKNFAPLYREDRNDPEKRAWYEYHYNINSETTDGREGVTIYTAIVDYYEGGAHGINQKIVMNFDNKTGKLLTLRDIFVPGFEQRLNEMLLNALVEKADAKDESDLRDRGYLYAMDMFAPENFVLGKKSVTFVYNHYEIASYDKGIIELELSYDDLEELIELDD